MSRFWPCWRQICGSLLTKACVSAVPCGIAAFLCHYNLHQNFEDWSASEAGITIYSGFTFALGFLIVFRMNQAYSRWWEAGTLLQQARAQWFNAYSSLIAMSNPAPEKASQVLRFHHMLARLLSLLYGTSILQLCTFPNPSLQTIHIEGMDEDHLKFLEECHDKVEIVLQWIQKAVVSADKDGVIQAAAPIVSRIYSQLGSGMADVAAARKMIEFPIPSPILQIIPFMLAAQWLATVIISTMLVRDSSWAALLSFMNTFCFWSINYLARELEMPYGDDPDDLPLHYLQADMNASLAGLLHPLALRTPSFDLPISAEGNVELQPGIIEMKHDGTINFRPCTGNAISNVSEQKEPNDSFGTGFESLRHDPRLAETHSQNRFKVFHVRKIAIGKRGRIEKGPSLEASARRSMATKAKVGVSHAAGIGTNAESEPAHGVTNNLGRAPVKLDVKTAEEEAPIAQSSLECSTSSGHCEDIDLLCANGAHPAEMPVTEPQLIYDDYDI